MQELKTRERRVVGMRHLAGREGSVRASCWAVLYCMPSLRVSSPFACHIAISHPLLLEILVDVVDVVLAGSGIDEKFLGLSLFALVPNTTEFMNAMSFAMNGNIALRCVNSSAEGMGDC